MTAIFTSLSTLVKDYYTWTSSKDKTEYLIEMIELFYYSIIKINVKINYL